MLRSQGPGEETVADGTAGAGRPPVVLRSAEVADRAGVNVETLRYYERRGLLPEPPRTASGYRCYPEAAVQRVRQVKTLQQLGFSLGDIAGLLDVRVDAPVRCDDLAGHARAKLAVVEDKLAALEQVRDALVEVTRACCAPTHDPSSCARLQPDPIDGQQR